MVQLIAALACLAGLAAAADTPITIARNAKIVVVGAGPAGIHYASLLADKGYSHITVLEKSPAVGGKSVTVTDSIGVIHELGTCYAHGLYTPVFDLFTKFDPENQKVPFIPQIKGHTWIHDDAKPGVIVDYNKYFEQSAAAAATNVSNVATEIAHAFSKYIGTHYAIFGKYPYGVPPQPKDWSQLRQPAIEFLRKNNLMVLEAFFRYVYQQQGYGILEETPAFYMLWWIHPDLIIERQKLTNFDDAWVFMMSKGYQRLWHKMVGAYEGKFHVRLNAKVTKIMRSKGVTKISFEQDGDTHRIRADHLVMAVDLSAGAPVPTPPTALESKLLDKARFTATTFVTTLYESDPVPNEGLSDWWPYRGAGDLQGRLQVTRNSRLGLYNPLPDHRFPNDSTPTDWGVNATGRQTRVAYQFWNRKPLDSDANAAPLVADMIAANMKGPKIFENRVWNYAPRFQQDVLESGAYWQLWDHQGEEHTTWVGSAVCFESVLDIVTYNNRLIKRVQFDTKS